jgi:CobQ/CobB/MinD/ParA nucleotide binding domain
MTAKTHKSERNKAEYQPILVWLFGKGGVGKTITAQVVRIAIQDLNRQVVAIDADAANSSFKRQVPEAMLIDGTDAAEMIGNVEEEIVQQALTGGHSMVIDTGNGTDRLSRQWFRSEEMDRLLFERGVQVVAITVLDSSLDSASHAMETIDALKHAKHILVKNLGHTPSAVGGKAFEPLFGNDEFKRYLETVQVIEMPRLADAVALDGLQARLHDIHNNTCPAELNPFVEARTKSWLSQVITKFQEALTQ